MTNTLIKCLALLCMSFAAAGASATIIEITGTEGADGLWSLSTTTCDRTDPACIQQLADQVWYTDFTLAEEFATICLDCLGMPNAAGNTGAYFNYIVPDMPEVNDIVGWAFNQFVGVAAWFGGNPTQTFAIAERVSVSQASSISLLILSLFAVGWIRKRRTRVVPGA
ncbi:MAG: hypothetical protein AAFO81_04580 [Pseudomonadota bacterium]